MKNPFRSEAAAYRFLIGTVPTSRRSRLRAAAGGRWAGLAVFVVATVGVLVWFFRDPSRDQPPAG